MVVFERNCRGLLGKFEGKKWLKYVHSKGTIWLSQKKFQKLENFALEIPFVWPGQKNEAYKFGSLCWDFPVCHIDDWFRYEGPLIGVQLL